MSEFLVITGLSGAGRSQAAATLEDLGWFVIDNLPTSLIDKIAELATAPGTSFERVALVVGAGPHQSDVLPALASLQAGGHRVRILFLEASTRELIRRYGETRRRHPLDDGAGLEAAIARERVAFEPVKEHADLVIDTTGINIHQLKAKLVDSFAVESPASGMQVAVESFGFKHGPPLDADLVIDCRFLPNPFWEERLRALTGLDEDVKGYVLERPTTFEFLARVDSLLELLMPAYAAEGKSYLTIAFGCTGGRHRSVAIAEEIARRLRRSGYDPRVAHRDLAR